MPPVLPLEKILEAFGTRRVEKEEASEVHLPCAGAGVLDATDGRVAPVGFATLPPPFAVDLLPNEVLGEIPVRDIEGILIGQKTCIEKLLLCIRGRGSHRISISSMEIANAQ